MNETKELSFVVAESGERLDQFLAAAMPTELGFTRSRIKRLIEGGNVTVDGEKALKAGERLVASAVIGVELPVLKPTHLTPYDFPLDILYEDDALVVINKPPGLTMHPGAGTGSDTLVHALIAHFRGAGLQAIFSGSDRPGIVHRLDRDTTGIVVIARTPAALSSLSTQFASRTVQRSYLALVLSTPRGVRAFTGVDEGEISLPLGRHPTQRTKFAVVPLGRHAVTRWRVIERMEHALLLQLSLLTGRTHQIRVHLTHVGAPILGDPVYGSFESLPRVLRDVSHRFGRQALHAETLGFEHPLTGATHSFTVPMPADMAALANLFRRA